MNKLPIKIVFMGTPEFAVPALDKIYNDPSFKILAVYTALDKPKGRGYKIASSAVKVKALQYNLPIFTPNTLKNNVQEIQNLTNLNPDIIVVVAYGLILPKTVLEIPKYGAINLHPSLLPKYRGASPIQYALLNGEKVTGNSIILMNERMDAGDILAREVIEISDDDNCLTLHEKLSSLGADLLVKTIKNLVANEIKPFPQDESQATYTTKITTDMAKICWAKSSNEIHNLIRAMYPDPCAWTSFSGERIKLHKSKSYETINLLSTDVLTSLSKSIGCKLNEIEAYIANNFSSGTILLDHKRKHLFVVCGNNTILEILELQRPGRSALSSAHFLMGFDIKTGYRFEENVKI